MRKGSKAKDGGQISPPSTSDLVYGRIMSISPLPAPATPPPPPTIVYRSPRCQVDDTDLFPTQRSFEKLRRPDDRWTYQSQVAGEHRQDANAFHVPPRVTPQALAAGIPKHFASQVTVLHLRNNDQVQQCQQHLLLLPEWLDVVATTFPSVLHLYLNAGAGATHEEKEEVPVRTNQGREGEGTSPSPTPQRLQRLYVLYRLPQLLSLDGIPITDTERELARPEDPRGQKVQRDVWLSPHPLTHSQKNQHRNRNRNQPLHQPALRFNSMGDDLAESDDDDYDDCDDDVCDDDASTPHRLSAADLGITSCESLVEVDLAGGLHLVDLVEAAPPPPPPPSGLSSSHLKRRGMDPPALFGETLTPQRLLLDRPGGTWDGDNELHLPYESPESNIDCEWSAACGGLSLPLMRSPGIRSWTTEYAGASGIGTDLPFLIERRRTSESKSDILKRDSAKSVSLGPRMTSRESLSSPFPMQFRTRARAGGSLSPSSLSDAQEDPPPPPPLPRVRLPSRQQSIVVSSDSLDSTCSAAIPPPPPPPPRSSSSRRRQRRHGPLRGDANNDGRSESPSRTESKGGGAEASPLSQVQTPARTESTSKNVTCTAKKVSGRQRPPVIPVGTASAASQRSKAIWAAKRMARGIRRRRPHPDQPVRGKDLVVGEYPSSDPESRRSSRLAATLRSILDQDTEEEDEDEDDEGSDSCSSTGSPTTSFGEEESDDCDCSDEENREHLVAG